MAARLEFSRSPIVELARQTARVYPCDKTAMFAAFMKETRAATGCEVRFVAAVLAGQEGCLSEAQRDALAGRLAGIAKGFRRGRSRPKLS